MTPRTGKLFLPTVLLTGALLLGGCGDDDSPDVSTGTTSQETTTSPAADGAAADAVSEVQLVDSDLGEILADGDGNTLYLFTPDSDTTSTCSGGCADTWPPLTGPASGSGIDAEDLGTTTREDGSLQVTFYGHPVYRYAADSGPGSTTGQGVGGKWYVIDAEGNAVTDDAGSGGGNDSGY